MTNPLEAASRSLSHTEPPGDPRRDLLDEWRAAEGRLALLAVTDPDGYLRHLEFVGLVVNRLADCSDVAELADAYADRTSFIDSVVPPARADLDVAALAGAAWLVRYRQLAGAGRQRQIEARIADARRRGEPWVTLWETEPAPPSPVFRPYERVEMRLADGVAVRFAIDIDPDTYEPVYSAETGHADPLDGSPIATGPAERRKVFADRASWERGADALLADALDERS